MANNITKSNTQINQRHDTTPNFNRAIERKRITNNTRDKETETIDTTIEEMKLPVVDKIKYGINNENIVSENDSINSHRYTLDDGRVLIYNKDDNNNLTLAQILTKNDDGTTKTIETFDEFGLKISTKNYEYDINGKIKYIKIEDNKTNTITTDEYLENNGKKRTIKNKDGKILSNIELDEHDNKIKSTNYVYDEKGNIIATSLYNGNKTITNFYKDGKISFSFPFDILNNNSFDSYYNHEDTTRIATQISELLTQDEINKINDKIKENVDSAGRGTGAGVAAAAVTLITELENKGILLPYYYSGGHVEGGPKPGLDTTWGGNAPGEGLSKKRYHNSLDCTGFVSWAIKTAGIDCTIISAEGNGKRISYDEAKPGSIFANSKHDVLVVNTYVDDNGIKHLICAESTTDVAKEAKSGDPNDTDGGIILSDVTNADNYAIYDMDEYYQEHSQK